MPFLIAFACSVASVGSAQTFICSDHTRVTLAGVRTRGPQDAAHALTGQRLRCQGFDSEGPGQLTATCRYASGADVGCDFVARGLAKSVPSDRRRHELASCDHRLTSAQQGPQSI